MLPFVEAMPRYYSAFSLSASFLNEPHFIFLDSGMGYNRLGRYSYITADPFLVLRSKGADIFLTDGRGTERVIGDPFAWLRRLWLEHRSETVPGLPPFQGGVAGYFGYDLCHHVERLPRRAVDDLDLPEMYVGIYDWVLAHDSLTGDTWLVSTGRPEGSLKRAQWRIDWVKERLCGASGNLSAQRKVDAVGAGFKPAPTNTNQPNAINLPDAPISGRSTVPLCSLDERRHHETGFRSNFSREAYLQAILKAKEYIAAGEIYQVNLSQRFETELAGHPWHLYSHLRQVNPAPFAAYLGFDDMAVICASPEQFLRVEGRRVETRPIKGTRPRGKTQEADRALAEELLSSEKDRAENVMIVDLLRNDIGRVCRVGSVHVPELVILEEYPTVFHLVSTVAGEIDDQYSSIDLLRACFPGGSVTGCPKIRSMEIIDELEPTQRGVYCGAIGYVGFDGSMNTNIVIRTITLKDGRAYFQVGGGIVADSDPEAEYQETLDKAYASMLALETLLAPAKAR